MPRTCKPPVPQRVHIKFCDTQTAVDVSQQAENRAVTLALHLPHKFDGCTTGLLVCERDGAIIYSGQYGTDPAAPVYIDRGVLYVTLWRDLTVGQVLRVQATGITPGGETVKSPVSPPLLFCDSLPDDVLIDAPEDLLNQLLQNMQDIKARLDGLPELALATDDDIDALFQ